MGWTQVELLLDRERPGVTQRGRHRRALL